MRLGRCDGVQERLRLCILGDMGSMVVRGEMGLSVSIMTMSPLSDRMGDEQPKPPLLKQDSSSSDRLRLRSMVIPSL